MRNQLLVLLSTALLFGSATPASALPEPGPEQVVCPRTSSPPGSRFEVTGDGSQAFVGGWTVDGADATLCFRGVGESTSILAKWTAPWVSGMHFKYESGYNNAILSGEVGVKIAVRFHYRGEPWTPWLGMRHDFGPVFSGGGSYGEGISGPGSTEDFRMQWRIEVDIEGPTSVDAYATISAG